ncbi:RNA polymerase sigma factor [Actinomadura rudentiformis]|uniref:Sigma-70 family RNA polymerase sigma factor n=1 Tax=Actinomadura rudentiformis TaxID=359158 RepID=A0A6H9YL94_9ACTN|nr:hypothetical protein [Actinomadura rudentiformis]KAB2339072.1 hypothetical protein F8566_48950 [Actinomadura rudentiformis]
MRGDPGSLYDAHAARLYAYCWSLVGDDAAAAVTDTFAATVQHPPRGDSVLWLYALARSACVERGALDRGFVLTASGDDPLLRAAGTLRADHREVLLLEAGEWLEIPDIARVVGIAPDTARQLLNVARARLERAVLDLLMRGTGSQSLDLIAAFEKGTLPQLLAHRAPDQPPAWLREHTLAAFEGELTGPLPGIVTTNPVVVIGSGTEAKGRPRRKVKSITAVAGIAASAAAAAGLLVSWPAAKGGGASSLLPSGGSGTTESTSDRPATSPNQTYTDKPARDGDTGKDGGTGTPGQGSAPLPSTGGGIPTTQPVPTKPGTTPPPEKGKPSPPEESPSPPEETPAVPPEESPSEPPATPPAEDPGTTEPTPTEPAPTEPTENPPAPPSDDPSPSPSSNPAPTPGEG